MCQFVSHLLIYVSAKTLFELVYNWQSYHKNKKVHFLLRHSVVAAGEVDIRSIQRVFKYIRNVACQKLQRRVRIR